MTNCNNHIARPQADDDFELLIIGIGNELRRDDGAGRALAALLYDYFAAAGISVRLITATQLLPEMAADLGCEGVRAVVFVDVATHAAQRQFEISRVDVDSPTAVSAHHLSPATLLLYAVRLYGHMPRGWIVTIPGYDFAHGEGFSHQVAQHLDNAELIATALHAILKDALLCTN